MSVWIVAIKQKTKTRIKKTKKTTTNKGSQYVTEIHQQYLGFTATYVEILNDTVITVSS